MSKYIKQIITTLPSLGAKNKILSMMPNIKCDIELYPKMLQAVFEITFKSLFHWFVSYISDQNLKMFGDWWVGLNADFAQSHISKLNSKDILFQFRSSSPLLKSKTRDLVANKYRSISTFIEYASICSIYTCLVTYRHFIK